MTVVAERVHACQWVNRSEGERSVLAMDGMGRKFSGWVGTHGCTLLCECVAIRSESRARLRLPLQPNIALTLSSTARAHKTALAARRR